MKILLLDSCKAQMETLRELSCGSEETVVVSSEEMRSPALDGSHPDIIIACGDSTDRATLTDALLAWRTHPHTCLIPCWITAGAERFEKACLWPRLSIDRLGEQLEPHSLCNWISAVAQWQQERMHFGKMGTFDARSPLELSTSLALRQATGKFLVFGEAGAEGHLALHEGRLADARLKHLRGTEAFFEFLSWPHGLYSWEQGKADGERHEDRPLSALIEEGLELLRSAGLFYHFLPDLERRIVRTESQSALDDGAIANFEAKKRLWGLIRGDLSASQLLEASPLSRPTTMSTLARWLSMGDVAPADEPEAMGGLQTGCGESQGSPCRLLIVDDSQLMCGALREVFSDDKRFEIVGFAHDGAEALSLIEREKPDVVTLDMQMPRMDGLTALKHIMIRDPKPVVVLSSFTEETSELTYESFKYGAVDVCTKPSSLRAGQLERDNEELRERVARAYSVRLEAAQFIRRRRSGSKASAAADTAARESSRSRGPTRSVVAVVCGAGGFPSLLRLLLSLSQSLAGQYFIICMEMASQVVAALLPNIRRDCNARVELLPEGAVLEPGVCYLHSCESTYRFEAVGESLSARRAQVRSTDEHPFDRFLVNMADLFAERTTALLISGTGDDGLEGMRYVHQRAGGVFVLSPDVCLKPELPGRLLELGYASEIKSAAEMGRIL